MLDLSELDVAALDHAHDHRTIELTVQRKVDTLAEPRLLRSGPEPSQTPHAREAAS